MEQKCCNLSNASLTQSSEATALANYVENVHDAGNWSDYLKHLMKFKGGCVFWVQPRADSCGAVHSMWHFFRTQYLTTEMALNSSLRRMLFAEWILYYLGDYKTEEGVLRCRSKVW
jgi:hypothetical protein